tara:strand:- start:47 stop:322 length:276 start_codon:yes stop_codon:yes gene_type:complete
MTYKQKFNRKYGFKLDEPHSLSEIAKITGYKESGLQTIFLKGKGAFFSNRSAVRPSVKSAEQWGFSRIYAALDKSSKAYKVDKSHLIKSGR